MNGHQYTALRLPTPLIDQVDHFMENKREHGFTTRAELIKQAIREFIDKYNGEGQHTQHNPISPKKTDNGETEKNV